MKRNLKCILKDKDSRDIIISGEIRNNCRKFWKVAILKKNLRIPNNCLWQSSHSNVVGTPAILMQKSFSKGEQWLFCRISEMHLKLRSLRRFNYICPGYLSAVNVLENSWLS